MFEPRTLALQTIGFRPTHKTDVQDDRLLRMACIILSFCFAAVISAAGQGFTVLHSFTGYTTGTGAESFTGLIQGSDGNFYGTTASGGGGGCTFGCGIIYRITADGALTAMYSFQYADWGPSSALIQASNGIFYGTTAWGGGSANCYSTNGCGTIYQITAQGAFNTLYSFNQPAGPEPAVIQATDGNLYGATYYGGSSTNCSMGCGTIFRLTLSGTLSTLHAFSGSDGISPGTLLQATDGNFYGIAASGGLDGKGTIFKLTSGGAFTLLHSFAGTDGYEPVALIQAKDGNFYGITVAGGVYNGGTVFKMTAAGSLTTVYSFCAQIICADGNEPWTLMQANDGNFYGTTIWGGVVKDGGGTIFEINSGTLTTIHKFTRTAGNYLGGESPIGGLMQAADGKFYGTTVTGGAYNNCGNGCGTIFTFGPAAATLSRTSVSFGNQALNETSRSLSVTLSNSGMTVLNISSVAVTPPEFAIATNSCTGAALTSGKQCTVTVTYTPTGMGLLSGTLKFTDNTGTSPQLVPLSGIGVEPANLIPTVTYYGDQPVGTTSAPKTLTLVNHQAVTLTNIAASTTGDFAISGTTCATSLPANERCTISVTFTPTQTGTRVGTLTITDSAGNSPQTSTLQGIGK